MTTRSRSAALVLSLLCLASSGLAVQPAAQSARDPIRVGSLGDGHFRLARGGVSTVLDLSPAITGCTGTLYDGLSGEKSGSGLTARVLDEVSRAGAWYLLLQVNTPANCNVEGMCGAGSSTDVIWLKLTPQLRVAARQAVPVDDCATDTELARSGGRDGGDPPPLQTRHGVLSLLSRADDYSAGVTTTLRVRYDRQTPQRGLVITRSRSALRP